MSAFLRKDEEYVRQVNVIEGYFKQVAIYISIMSGQDINVVKAWLRKEFAKGGKFELNTPVANITVRDKETGDRRQARISMEKLFRVMEQNELIVSPSMTFYIPAKVKRSLLAEFIDENIQKRGRVKKEMQAAQAAGNKVLAANKKNAQNSYKQRNNALSGAHSSPYTILYNKSTHSSLTSMCRSATSYGNANNEKLLASSRHYWAPGIVVNNILSTIDLTDFVKFQECIDKYNLYIPSTVDTIRCIERSTKLYWKNDSAMDHICTLVRKLTPIQRAAFVYIGDLYQVRKFNSEVVRTLLDELLEYRVDYDGDVKDVEKRLDGDTEALISLLRRELVSGNFDRTSKEAPEDYRKLMGACNHIYSVMDKYDLFIKEIMTTSNVPASIARLPDIIRRVSLVSDTDSTMATVQRWAEWYCGDGIMTGRKADDVSDLMIYIATQNIAHMMARMSTNIGVEKKYLHRYAMKNEYKFSSFSLTNKAKHYFSLITSQEGVIKKEPELEMKGVALRTSNIPPIIMDEFRNKVTEILTTVMEGKKIRLFPILNHIANIEHKIVKSVHDGDYTYLKTSNIKTPDAYKEPQKSAYVYHQMWEATFGKKYGSAGTPSYTVVKISVKLESKTEIKRWLDGMKDRRLASDLAAWMAKSPDRKYTQFLLPEAIVASGGIPKEILDIANYRRIIFTSVEPYYHVLESLGVVMIDKNRTRLFSDYYGTSLINTEEKIVPSTAMNDLDFQQAG